MRILRLTPRLSYSLTDGGKRGIFNIIMVALSFPINQYLSELKNYCTLETIQLASKNALWIIIRNLFSSTPHTVSKYYRKRIAQRIINILKNEHFGISIIEALQTGCLIFVYYSGGQKEIIAPDIPGFKTKDDLISKIQELISNTGKLQVLLKQLRDTVSRFHVSLFYGGINELLGLMLKEM